MKFMAILRVGLRALARNKMRSLLTMLGIIIGVGAVIAMIAIADGARAQVQAQIASMGTNVVMVFPGSVTQGGVRSGFGSITSMTGATATAAKKKPCAAATNTPDNANQRALSRPSARTLRRTCADSSASDTTAVAAT